jgi:hypothetical protein
LLKSEPTSHEKKNIFKGYTWLHTRLALTVDNSLNCVRIPFTSRNAFCKAFAVKIKKFQIYLERGRGRVGR